MIEWEQVELMDATHVEINGEVHEIKTSGNQIKTGGKVIKSGKLSIDGKYRCISILISMYDWMEIPQEAFPLIGIRCLRKKERKPIEFTALVVEGTYHKRCKPYLVCPQELFGKKFKCVEILEEENKKA
jgi:hypothetical protein